MLMLYLLCAVLLAPYGMSGMLTGRSFLETDHKVQKILEDWRRFFCFPRIDNCSIESGKELPPAVEVIVGRILIICMLIFQGNLYEVP